MKKKFIATVATGNFAEAKKLIRTFPENDSCDFLVSLVLETNLLGLYTLVFFLLLEEETIALHECAIAMLLVSTWEGANGAAFLHARRVAQIAPQDLSKKQALLFYFGIPDCRMSRNEAEAIARELLAADPHNPVAEKILEQIAMQD